MTFGNPFGLALYDKAQENVVDGPSPAEMEAIAYVTRARPRSRSDSIAALKEWWLAESKNRQLHQFTNASPLYQDLYTAFCKRGEALAGPQREAAQ
jgi:DNA repair and recombination protein RAD52